MIDNLRKTIQPDTRLSEVYALAFGYLSAALDSFLSGYTSKEQVAGDFQDVMVFIQQETERRIASGDVDQAKAHGEYLTFIRQTEKEQVTGEPRKSVRLGGALYDRVRVTKP